MTMNRRGFLGRLSGRGAALVLAVLALALSFGCRGKSSENRDPSAGATTGAAAGPGERPESFLLRVGDKLKIEIRDTPTPMPMFETQIRDDGTITLPVMDNSRNTIKAADKRLGDLESEIHALYVPSLFLKATVSVQIGDRFYFVQGQVNRPGAILYVGDTTVLKAIAAAGDFTDFADKRNVQLTRVNGRIYTINCKKALTKPALDLAVYPGDKVYVPRTITGF
jgi:polysaccharide export outer membrane protein